MQQSSGENLRRISSAEFGSFTIPNSETCRCRKLNIDHPHAAFVRIWRVATGWCTLATMVACGCRMRTMVLSFRQEKKAISIDQSTKHGSWKNDQSIVHWSGFVYRAQHFWTTTQVRNGIGHAHIIARGKQTIHLKVFFIFKIGLALSGLFPRG